jgi:hypothetical protein
MGVVRKKRIRRVSPRHLEERERSGGRMLRPWIFLGAAGLGAALYLVGRELLLGRGKIEVEVDLAEAADLELDEPAPDVLDEAWMPSDGHEALPGRG